MPDPVVNVRSSFLDRQKVIDAVGRARARVLAKWGAFVRRRARSSMRRRSSVAPAGSPPSAHAGQLKDLLFFAVDPDAKSVVVGPVPFGRGEAPHLLEFGGATRRQPPGGKARTVRYRGNPFMGPALEAEAENFADVWSDSVRP